MLVCATEMSRRTDMDAFAGIVTGAQATPTTIEGQEVLA
jgi:hypothetical protein